MTQFDETLLHRFAAPGISALVRLIQAEAIPDLRGDYPEHGHWLGNHFLSSAITGSFAGRSRQAVFIVIFRTQAAFRHYHFARDATIEFAEHSTPGQPSLRRYYHAIQEWENTILQWGMAADAFRRHIREDAVPDERATPERRAHMTYNRIKHHAEDIAAGKLDDDVILPLWLTPTGMQCHTTQIDFSEVAKLMRDLGSAADQLQDPAGFVASRSNQH